MRVTVLPPKKIAAEFELEHFYGAGQRGLRHIALLRRAREVELIGNREKIADRCISMEVLFCTPMPEQRSATLGSSNHAAIVTRSSQTTIVSVINTL